MDKKLELERLMKEKLNVAELDRDALISSYGLDSLDIVEFLLGLEEKFGISFDPEDIKDIKTVGEMFDVLVSKI